MSVTIDEFREKVRSVKHPTEVFEVEPGFEVVVGGVASFGSMQSRAAESAEVEKGLVAFPLKDGDGNAIPVTPEALQMAVLVACGVREPVLSIRDALELSVSHPLQYGQLLDRVATLSSSAVAAEVDAAEERLALDPPTAPSSPSPCGTEDGTRKSGAPTSEG